MKQESKKCKMCSKVLVSWNTSGYCRDCYSRKKMIKRGKFLEQVYHRTWYYKNIIKPSLKGGNKATYVLF